MWHGAICALLIYFVSSWHWQYQPSSGLVLPVSSGLHSFSFSSFLEFDLFFCFFLFYFSLGFESTTSMRQAIFWDAEMSKRLPATSSFSIWHPTLFCRLLTLTAIPLLLSLFFMTSQSGIELFFNTPAIATGVYSTPCPPKKKKPLGCTTLTSFILSFFHYLFRFRLFYFFCWMLNFLCAIIPCQYFTQNLLTFDLRTVYATLMMQLDMTWICICIWIWGRAQWSSSRFSFLIRSIHNLNAECRMTNTCYTQSQMKTKLKNDPEMKSRR